MNLFETFVITFLASKPFRLERNKSHFTNSFYRSALLAFSIISPSFNYVGKKVISCVERFD